MLIRLSELLARELDFLTVEFRSEVILDNDPKPLLTRDVDKLLTAKEEVMTTGDLSGLLKVKRLEIDLFPSLYKKTYRERLLPLAKTFLDNLPPAYPLYKYEGDDRSKSLINSNNVDQCINFYKQKYDEVQPFRDTFLGNLDKFLEEKYEDEDSYYINTYRSGRDLTEYEEFICKLFSVVAESGNDSYISLSKDLDLDDPNLSIDELVYKVFTNISETTPTDLIEEQLLTSFATLAEMDVLTEDKAEDEIAEASKDLKDDAKEYEVAKDTGNKSKLAKAKSGLKKSGKSVAKIIQKALSFKSDDIDKTLSIKYKALRFGIAALVIAGGIAFPSSLIGKLVGSIVSTTIVKGYSTARAKRTKGVLESQMTYLQDKMDREDDPEIKRELNLQYKEIEVHYNDLLKRMDRDEQVKDKIRGR